MSLSFTEIIRNNIIEDVSSDRTAQDLVSYTTIDGLPLFSASTQVPEYLYTPIWELLGLSSSAELAENVICNYGERKIPSGPCIIIEPTIQMESCKSPRGTLHSSETGAKYAECLIKVQNVRTGYTINRVEQVSMRLEWLIDMFARQDRGTYKDLTVVPGYGIVPNFISDERTGAPFQARYWESGVSTVSDWTHLYSAEFVRVMV